METNQKKESEQLKDSLEDETEIRESGPLESNDPKTSTGKIETVASQKQQEPDMVELPMEVVKSSRAPRVVEVNLPPRVSQPTVPIFASLLVVLSAKKYSGRSAAAFL